MTDKKIKELKREKDEILNWFLDNDYKAIKVFNGFWDKMDSRYIDYLKQYEIKHDRLEEIEKLLKN